MKPHLAKISVSTHPIAPMLAAALPFIAAVVVVEAQEAEPAEAAAPARTADDGPFVPDPVLPGGVVVPLYPPGSPKLDAARVHEAEQYNTTRPDADRLLTTINIHNPTIEFHPVPEGIPNTGAAVVVAPGGGHRILWVGPEGYDLVAFFREVGVATAVLRNRLRVDGYVAEEDAVDDAFQAIRLVRSRAEEWGLDPAKIGIMGFSAGAELAAPAALFYEKFQADNSGDDDPLAEVSARPDFAALVYPGPTPFARGGEPAIPADVPPSFLVCAGADDRVHAVWADEFFSPMLRRGVPNLEMHIYARGGHGGSIGPRDGIPFGTWPARFLEWFRDLGFLGAPGEVTRAAQDIAAYAERAQERARRRERRPRQ